MKAIFVIAGFVCSATAVSAQNAHRITELEPKVQSLEERLAVVEAAVRQSPATPEAKKMREIARRHMEEERKRFSADEIARAEALYARSSRSLSSEASKQMLDSVVGLYPQLNRAGCAQLYRAQQEHGAEKERLLKDCIDRFGSCYYGDGTQVGPYAMFLLASLYQWAGRKDEADKLFSKLRKEYPDAIDHSGALLISKIQ